MNPDIIPAFEIAPDGKSEASLLLGTTGVPIWQDVYVDAPGEYYFSIFVKGNGGGQLSIEINNDGEFLFNPDTTDHSGDGGFETLGGGWFEVYQSRYLYPGMAKLTLQTKGVVNAGVVVFGASFGLTHGSYIPTSEDPVTIIDYESGPSGLVIFAIPPELGSELLWVGDYDFFRSKISATEGDIYLDVRQFMLRLFPGSEKQIIQSSQNNMPLPYGAIVMHVLFEKNLDESSTFYTTPSLSKSGAAHVQNSVEVRMQLSFYGDDAQVRSRTVCNLWKNHYGSDALSQCQPLYVYSYQRLPYINDSNNYEDRFILDLALQYNPYVTHAQDFTQEARVTIKPIPEH